MPVHPHLQLPILADAGFTPDSLRQVEHLLVGCGGFVKELLRFTAGASTVKQGLDERLSAADCVVDRILREHLVHLVPNASGYSEEAGEFGSHGDGLRTRWLIDPVDGTRPAALGGAFAVSLGALVLEGEEPLAALGWVYVPTLSLLFRGVLSRDRRESLLNGRPVQAEPAGSAQLPSRHVAVNSDWHRLRTKPVPMKLAAMGATAVHLVELVQPGSDVAAAALTRYRPYDAAGGVPAAVAGGCSVYALDQVACPAAEPLDPLQFLAAGAREPGRRGAPVLVATEEAAAALR